MLYSAFFITDFQSRPNKTLLISLLVLSSQEESFNDIKENLQNDYFLHLVDSVDQFNDLLIDGTIDIVIIDTTFLMITNQNELIETLSFFPELPLIAIVESGETENLVSMFQNFDIYRYLQKPLNTEHFKKSIDAAVRKTSKKKKATPLNTDNNLNKNNWNKFIFIAPVLLIFISSFIYFKITERSHTEETNAIHVELEEKPVSENKLTHINKLELLTIEHEKINLSAKAGLSKFSDTNDATGNLVNINEKNSNQADSKTNQITQEDNITKLINNINEKINSGNTIKPDNDSAKYFLIELAQKAPEHPERKRLESNFISKMLSQAETAIDSNDLNQARVYINEAKLMDIENKAITTTENRLNIKIKQIEEIKITQERQKKILRLSKLASEAIERNNLVFPEKNNAKYFLQTALKLEPENKKIQSQLLSLMNLLLIQIEKDISEHSFASASSRINKAKELTIKEKELSLLETKLKDAIQNR